MQRANQAACVLWPKLWVRVRREPLDRSELCPTQLWVSRGTDEEARRGGEEHYLIQGICDAIGALRNVQREHLTRVDDERDHARGDEERDEHRRDRVETSPAVELDEQRRHNHTDRA